jgi:hypothetical protein
MRRALIISLLLLIAVCAAFAIAGPRSSANYSILADALDNGGVTASSANYKNDGSAGLISGTSTTAGTGVLKSGYIAQLEDTSTPPTINISGNVIYCSNPSLNPVAGVTMTMVGTIGGTTVSDGSGNYTLSSLTSGGSYTVTPTKAGLAPGSTGINTIDVVATQRYFLNIGTPLSGCRLTAADVNGSSGVNTIDVVAIQRFFLGQTVGTANVGKYRFAPVNRSYSGIVSNQAAQNYNALIFGDVAASFAGRPDGSSQDAPELETLSHGEVATMVESVALPEVMVDAFVTDFVLPVTATTISASDQLVGFQGDFNFDQRVVTFQSEPVQKAGITGGNWNVSGNVLPGKGPIRTLRISAYSNDFTALNGSGTLFELRMTMVDKAAHGTQLIWAAPPDDFIFIDADLGTHRPSQATPGSVTSRSSKR